MRIKHSSWVVVACCGLLSMLVSCGSGSDGGTTNDPANLAPFADAGEDRLVQQGSFVELDGSSSSDPDGQIVSYHWVQTRGTGVSLSDASTVSPSFIAPQTSTREELGFLLTVQDNNSAHSTDTVTITVNIPPIADAGADQTLLLGNPSTETVTLAGDYGDSDGDVIAHLWVQTGGPAVALTDSDTPIASFTVIATTAAYTFSYTVTDNDGAQTTDTVSVYVSKIIFSDSFSDDSDWQGRWAPLNDTPTLGQWGVIEGQLRQSRTVESVDSFHQGNTSYHLGTYVLLVDLSISDITSYRFSVDVTPLTNTTGIEGNDVGIMFGYNGSDYYRVALNARYGFTRFEKRTGGKFETLAVNAIGYVNGQPMHLTAEVNDDTIIVWIDGDPVFAVVDNAISGGSVALYCQDSAAFDNVLITANPLQPLVVLSTPLAYSVASTRDEGDTLTAEAIVLNKPEGGSVWFALDDGPETAALEVGGNIYLADFEGVPDGDYDVTALLRNVDGREVSHDINSMVGVGGDYFITVGDSITNGIGDEIPWNNDSLDGRIVSSQGFQARLADRLTATTRLPQILFNEGIGGDTAARMELRIDSILERHPSANKILLMIGTNDSDVGVDPDVFGNTVSQIVGKMNGRQVWLAKPMPTFIINSDWTLDGPRNNIIKDYNVRINQIAQGNPNAFLGPNFYDRFSGRIDLYQDYLHPNDTGYVFMADRWHDVLAQ